MRPFKPLRSFPDQPSELRDRSLQSDDQAEHLEQVMNADAAVVAQGAFPC